MHKDNVSIVTGRDTNVASVNYMYVSQAFQWFYIKYRGSESQHSKIPEILAKRQQPSEFGGSIGTPLAPPLIIGFPYMQYT
jgi:hypothetical protein